MSLVQSLLRTSGAASKLSAAISRVRGVALPTLTHTRAGAAAASFHSRAGLRSAASDSKSAGGSVDLLSPESLSVWMTPTQSELYSVACSFADTHMRTQASGWDEHHTFPEETLRQLGELGFGGLYVKEDVGGSGLSRFDSMPIIEALAGACTSTTAYLTIHNMCAWMIDTFADDELRREWLPRLVKFDLFSSYCLTEPNAGSDAGALATRARRDGDSYVLNGSKMFISGGGRSDVYVIMARTGDNGPAGISCFLVPKDTPGLSFGKQEKKLGWRTQPTAAVFMENVRIPANNRIGKEGDGFRIAMRGLNGGRLSIAACSLGAAAACTQIAREYVKTRKQFGKPLAANQAVAFMLADMATKVHTSRITLHNAAALLDKASPAAPAACAMAKRYVTDACFDVCNDALQLHGGYGYLQDYPIERFLRDVRVHQILEGTNQVMNIILSRQLLE